MIWYRVNNTSMATSSEGSTGAPPTSLGTPLVCRRDPGLNSTTSRAATTSNNRLPVSPWPMQLQPEEFGLPSSAIHPEWPPPAWRRSPSAPRRCTRNPRTLDRPRWPPFRSSEQGHKQATSRPHTGELVAGGRWTTLNDHSSRAATSGRERVPVILWPVHPHPKDLGLP